MDELLIMFTIHLVAVDRIRCKPTKMTDRVLNKIILRRPQRISSSKEVVDQFTVFAHV